MIVEKLLPEVYYNESRDFAYVGRVFEFVFNYMKTAAECVNVNYDTVDNASMVIDLLADSVGFTAKHKYDSKNLIAITNAFQQLLREKGSIIAIESAISIMMNVQQIVKTQNLASICEFDAEDNCKLIIYLPKTLTDVVLLEDLFEYILPAGVLYEFRTISDVGNTSGTDIISVQNYASGEYSSADKFVNEIYSEKARDEYIDIENMSTDIQASDSSSLLRILQENTFDSILTGEINSTKSITEAADNSTDET